MKNSTFFGSSNTFFSRLIIPGLVFLLLGCNSSRLDKEHIPMGTGSSINKDLLELVKKQIHEYDGYFIDKDWLYYNVLFWSSDSKSYLTIWVFVTYPNYIEDCFPDKRLSFGLEEISKRKVVFIKSELELELYDPSKESKASAALESQKPFEGPIYDGPVYEVTYRIDMSKKAEKSYKYSINNFPVLNCANLKYEMEIDDM